jgi:putative oxygen-independent coproporphyrinogen III oxidase
MQIPSPKPLAVYIHWPFCLSKCPYCDFNSHVRDSVDHKAWEKALVSEIAYYAGRLPHRRVESVFFGGGTPSLMHPETVSAVLDAIAKYWHMAKEVEITLEANPTSSETGKFAAFASAGVNRVSLGVQALHDEVLAFLGRTHSAAHALEAVEMAARHFYRYSFDLIYARPGQTVTAWERELRHALSYAGDHLSLYQLTIEPGTAFYHAHARGDLKELDEEQAAELYLATQSLMESAGMPAYEISNHARPGQESRHNLAYWRYRDYAGIGPGAHGRITLENGTKIATQAIRSPEKWLTQVQRMQHGCEAESVINSHEQFEERLLMGLRLTEGIVLNTAEWKRLNPRVLEQLQAGSLVCHPERSEGSRGTEGDSSPSAQDDSMRLQVTPKGRLLLNGILAKLLS